MFLSLLGHVYMCDVTILENIIIHNVGVKCEHAGGTIALEGWKFDKDVKNKISDQLITRHLARL